MIIFGCPFNLRYFAQIGRDRIRRIIHTFRPAPAGKIHFIYFSYCKDFPLLALSIRSLSLLKSSSIGKIFIVVDLKGPFTSEQIIALQTVIPDVTFLSLGKIDWASIETLQTEISAFAIVASKAKPLDFIAKVDSDILFFDKTRLDEISVCREDFIGDGHYSEYKYAQGGLYFLRAPFASRLCATSNIDVLAEAIQRCGTNAEDQVISELARDHTKKIWLLRIMLFPNEYERTNLSKLCVRNEFSAIHFVHRKSDMMIYARKLGIN